MKQKYTPGPWQWELNEKSKDVHLCGGRPLFDKTVMDFARYGFYGAAPRFNNAESGFNFMERCDHFGATVEGRQHHQEWFKTISHPDALLIAAAPDLLEALQVYVNSHAGPTEAYSMAKAAIQKATMPAEPEALTSGKDKTDTATASK